MMPHLDTLGQFVAPEHRRTRSSKRQITSSKLPPSHLGVFRFEIFKF